MSFAETVIERVTGPLRDRGVLSPTRVDTALNNLIEGKPWLDPELKLKDIAVVIKLYLLTKILLILSPVIPPSTEGKRHNQEQFFNRASCLRQQGHKAA